MAEKENKSVTSNGHTSGAQEAARLSRRSALRRLGFTVGAGLFGMLAADDAVRLVIAGLERHRATREIANTLAHDFRDAGVAFAQTSHCGVQDVPCAQCAVGEDGQPIGDCACNPYSGPCLSCIPPSNCNDCEAVADYKYCCCKQKALNDYPTCADCGGNPTGNPLCVQFNTRMATCTTQHSNDLSLC